MIFVTIGLQEPFDRLVRAMDEIAPQLDGLPVVAQVFAPTYRATHIQTFEMLSPAEFDAFFDRASLIVAHAGMGTIISALVKGKPLIVLPRLKKYKEHRSDHQLATAEAIQQLNYVHVASDENDLKHKVVDIIRGRAQGPLHRIGPYASPELLHSLRQNIGLH
jgi:UDP-N-acetylglucosamine transferase subunit ALG13